MLNENKVILMTKLASYEKKEGEKNTGIGSYFRDDYLAIQLIKSIIYATVSFAIIFGLFVLYDLEKFTQDIYKIDLAAFAGDILKYYVITVGIYAVLSYVIYLFKYIKVKKSLKIYYKNLKKLSSLYDEQ